MDKPKELPPKYYLTYFEYLLDFVAKYYGEILSEEERDFLIRFNSLQENEKCLYVRLANRRGSFFRMDKLDYAELNPIEEHLPALLETELAHEIQKIKEAELIDFFRLFTKDDLLKSFKFLEDDLGSLKSYKRDQLVALISDQLSVSDITEVLLANVKVVKQAFAKETLMFRFLFFGNLQEDMSSFVVRDIGHLKIENHKEVDFVPNFKTREEAVSKLWALLLYEQYRLIRDDGILDELFEWFFEQVVPFKEGALALAQPILDRLTLRVASLLEKAKEPERAFKVYQNTQVSPSRERQARILQNLGETENAISLCEEMLDSPKNVKESVFARDFLKKIKGEGRKKLATILKQQSEYAPIDLDYINDVEIGALAYYETLGYQGFFAENYIWRSLFGLLLWEEIFDGASGGIHHPLQTAPSDFFKESFREDRKKKITQKLKKLENKKQLIKHLKKIHSEKEGVANPMVSWHPSLLENLEVVCERVEGKSLKEVLWLMAGNLKEYTKGFPDLFVWKEQDYNFVEVKSPNDQLSNLQYFWQGFFKEQNIKASVLNVYW